MHGVQQSLGPRSAVVAATALSVVIGISSCSSGRRSVETAYESKRLATAAVEAGLLAGKAYLRDHCQEQAFFTALLSTPSSPRPLPIRDSPEGADLRARGASYRVVVFNNADDPRFQEGTDGDGSVMLVATGSGPLGDETTYEALVVATRCPGEVAMKGLRRRP